MADVTAAAPAAEKPLRLWPGIVIAAVVVCPPYVVPIFAPDAVITGVLGAVVGAAGIVIWWLFFSRAPWSERLGALLVIVAIVFAVKPLLHASISTGLMGNMFYVYAVPSVVVPAFVAWAFFSRRMSTPSSLGNARRNNLRGVCDVDAPANRWRDRRSDGAAGLALDEDGGTAAAGAGGERPQTGCRAGARACGAGYEGGGNGSRRTNAPANNSSAGASTINECGRKAGRPSRRREGANGERA